MIFYFLILQRYEPSSKGNKGHRTSIMDLQAIKTLKSDIPGNKRCVDCDVPSKYYKDLYLCNISPWSLCFS